MKNEAMFSFLGFLSKPNEERLSFFFFLKQKRNYELFSTSSIINTSIDLFIRILLLLKFFFFFGIEWYDLSKLNFYPIL